MANAVGQRFRSVLVHKAISYQGRLVPFSLRLSNMYSVKVTGRALPRSIMNLEPSERWIAPDDFGETMARGLDIRYGEMITASNFAEKLRGYNVISTLPMPVMMNIVGWEHERPNFEWQEVWSARVHLPEVDLYQTIYYPDTDPENPWYRASITGSTLIVEYMLRAPENPGNDIEVILDDFGLLDMVGGRHDYRIVHQKYGKLLPIPEEQRRAFILALTDRYGIYSLGRFGTWRQILLDDLIKDVSIIEQLISSRDSYARRLTWEK